MVTAVSDVCNVSNVQLYVLIYKKKKHSRKYSMNKCKQRQEKEQQLNEELQEAHLAFQNDPSKENLVALNVLKERMEKMYEEKVEGIIVRSRARHEHGEKNSKYFLNLEKWNHIRKHVRKLQLSGVITSDPFEILQAEKRNFMKVCINLAVMVCNEMKRTLITKNYQYQSFRKNVPYLPVY